jgi:hypothetical protein
MQSSVSVTYPLLLMAVDRAFEDDRAARAMRFAALAILLCLTGGFPHWILYGAIAIALYFLLRALERGGRATWRALGRLSGSAAIAIAILLPSILATSRFLSESGYRELRRGLGASFALPLRQMRLYFLPEYHGTPRRDDYSGVGWIPGDNYIETASGVGVAGGALALVGLTALARRKEALFAAILGTAIAIPLYGGGSVLSAVGHLPLLGIGLFARAKILIVLAAAILAACGAEALERLAQAEGLRRLALRTVPFLVAVPLAFLTFDFYPICRPSEAVFRETPGLRRLRERILGGARFAAAGWTLIPNVAEALALDDVRGHFLLDADYRRLIEAVDPNAFGPYGTYLVFDPLSFDPASPVLDLLGVKILAAPPGVSGPVGPEIELRDAAPFHAGSLASRPPSSPAPLRRVYGGPDLTLFERDTAFPRFSFVAKTLPGGVDEVRRAARETLRGTMFVPEREHVRLSASEHERGKEGATRIVELSPERFVLETESASPTLLVSSQKRFPPYWRTYLDGREVASLAANGIFLGLEVPAGRHRVEGRFVVPGKETAASLLGFLALAAVFWRARNLKESPVAR